MSRIELDWQVAEPVCAFSTTRLGGVSRGPWASFNLGQACGDDVEAVAENHRRLADHLPASPRWLKQVHGTSLIHLDDWEPGIEADAAWTDRPDQVAAILTADCLPVLLAHRSDPLVAAVHAGWRGLAAGILEQTVAALPAAPDELVAWIGPSISQPAYEVGEPVRDAFKARDASLVDCFEPTRRGHSLADLKAIAGRLLGQAGLVDIRNAGLCTASDPQRFFSHRRDHGRTGRQASLIWIRRA
jgi:polyphenol oxidase